MPATSKKQRRFFGMVHATQKGEISAPSSEVAEAAESIDPGDAEDFASTKHKGLPEKKAKDAALAFLKQSLGMGGKMQIPKAPAQFKLPAPTVGQPPAQPGGGAAPTKPTQPPAGAAFAPKPPQAAGGAAGGAAGAAAGMPAAAPAAGAAPAGASAGSAVLPSRGPLSQPPTPPPSMASLSSWTPGAPGQDTMLSFGDRQMPLSQVKQQDPGLHSQLLQRYPQFSRDPAAVTSPQPAGGLAPQSTNPAPPTPEWEQKYEQAMGLGRPQPPATPAAFASVPAPGGATPPQAAGGTAGGAAGAAAAAPAAAPAAAANPAASAIPSIAQGHEPFYNMLMANPEWKAKWQTSDDPARARAINWMRRRSNSVMGGMNPAVRQNFGGLPPKSQLNVLNRMHDYQAQSGAAQAPAQRFRRRAAPAPEAYQPKSMKTIREEALQELQTQLPQAFPTPGKSKITKYTKPPKTISPEHQQRLKAKGTTTTAKPGGGYRVQGTANPDPTAEQARQEMLKQRHQSRSQRLRSKLYDRTSAQAQRRSNRMGGRTAHGSTSMQQPMTKEAAVSKMAVYLDWLALNKPRSERLYKLAVAFKQQHNLPASIKHAYPHLTNEFVTKLAAKLVHYLHLRLEKLAQGALQGISNHPSSTIGSTGGGTGVRMGPSMSSSSSMGMPKLGEEKEGTWVTRDGKRVHVKCKTKKKVAGAIALARTLGIREDARRPFDKAADFINPSSVAENPGIQNILRRAGQGFQLGSAALPGAVGAAGGAAYGALAPGQDAEGERRSRVVEALKRALIGGGLGAGAGWLGGQGGLVGGLGGGLVGAIQNRQQGMPGG